MKTILFIIFSTLITIPLMKCKSSKVESPNLTTVKKLYFGSGGGFAGTYTEYALLENGQFFGRLTTNQPWQEFDPIPAEQTAQYFSLVDELKLKKMEFNTPGNWSYYLILEEGDQPPHKIQWCNEAKPQDERIIAFYKTLESHTKELPPFKANNPVR